MLHIADEDVCLRLFSKDVKALDVRVTSWFVLDLCSKGYDGAYESVCETPLEAVIPSRKRSCTLWKKQ